MELSCSLCFHDRKSPWLALFMILIVLSDCNLSKFHKWILRIIVWPSNLTSPQPQKNLCIIKIYKDSSKKKGAMEKGPCRTSREIKNLLSSTYSTIHLFQGIQRKCLRTFAIISTLVQNWVHSMAYMHANILVKSNMNRTREQKAPPQGYCGIIFQTPPVLQGHGHRVDIINIQLQLACWLNSPWRSV